MPSLGKKSISLYLRNGCERQFVLSLYGDPEREKHGLPPRQKARPGLGLVGAAGYEWQDAKVSELKTVFGTANIHENPVRKGGRPSQIPLLDALAKLTPCQFIVEAKYDSDSATFRSAIGLTSLKDFYGDPVSLGELHPDIIQSLPPMRLGVWPAPYDKLDPYAMAVSPDGNLTLLPVTDRRLRLRVIDVKLTAEPGAHYFAEVVYYSMTLAAWLEERHLDGDFVVVAAPAVWPGSHEASNLARQFQEWKLQLHIPTAAEMSAALEEDIEVAPFDVFSARLRRLLAEELPLLLSRPWQDLKWYVDFRCKGCEFLGFPWLDEHRNPTNDPLHCLPTAEQIGHLSRVVGLSRGGSQQLRRNGVADVPALAVRPSSDAVFDEHQGLKAKRTTFPHRARALETNTTSIIPDSGSDALMPRWPNLHIYVFLDYDLSSAITAAISLRASWREPLPFGSTLTAQDRWWIRSRGEDEVFAVDQRKIERERDELLKFLRQMRKILSDVAAQDQADVAAGRRDKKTAVSTYQIYLWDEAQRKHLVRIIGRHLPFILADQQLHDLAWLFPPPELLQRADDATRQSPITLVANVVDNTLAIPIPHHYRLLDIVEHYHPNGGQPPSFHPLYHEPMSDLIPGERLHEWWQRIGNFTEKTELVVETTRKKGYALALIVRRLEDDLKDVLNRQAAPPVVKPARPLTNVAPQSRLWYEFARLNVAIESLDVNTTRSMPPHEREARMKSARLIRRLEGKEEDKILAHLNTTFRLRLRPGPSLFTYEMAQNSREVNMRPGDFTCALAPENRPGFLDESPYRYLQALGMQGSTFGETIADAGLTGVSIEAIDRVGGFIALRASAYCCVRQIEQGIGLDFSQNVVLDPVHKDFLTSKVKLTVQGIAHPPIAQTDLRTLEALGMPANWVPGNSAITPAAELLWDAPNVYTQRIAVDLSYPRKQIQSYLDSNSARLDSSQWAAWEEALTRRLTLLWGPPGTGKSRTLRAVVLGAVLGARAVGQPLRLLITANTYTAIDNVLLDLDRELAAVLPSKPYGLYRIQSEYHPVSADLTTAHPDIANLILNTANPTPELLALRQELEQPQRILIVGCPPQQLHNMAVAGTSSGRRQAQDTIRSWFDRIVLDEASQMDMASSTLVFSKLAADGACVLAGDDLQLPPIQPAEPPKDLEDLVGSAYNYFRHHHGIIPCSLDVNYRSNETIVEFTRLAGYSPQLRSYSPQLRLNFSSPVPPAKPANWPTALVWAPEWAKFLSPDKPAVGFVYDDDSSSQVNDFEADSVACLISLMHGRLADRLENEVAPDGSLRPKSTTPYSVVHFWKQAVGVVTPHKAQMAKIIGRLQEVFPTDPPEGIRDAVDTVERFQGQQRDVIIASFGLGDPDMISTEDEFLYSLNRFNVLTSRARAKLIVFVTRPMLEHLSDDADVLVESRLLKLFAESYCVNPQRIELAFRRNSTLEQRTGFLRSR